VSRATFFKLHSWLGIISGLFLLVIAWTGSLAVFKDEVDWLLTPAVRADAGLPVRPLDDIVSAVRARYPDRRIAVNVPYGPHWTYTAFVYSDGPTRFLYIDPATAAVKQDDEMNGYTWNAGYFIRQLHVRMLMGLWGRVLVGIFGVILVLSVITSLWIYRDWLRSLVRVRAGAGRRIFHMDLHKSVGLWALAFNLMFGVTGAVLGLENVYNQIARARRTNVAPARPANPVTATASASASASVASVGARLVTAGVVAGSSTAASSAGAASVPATVPATSVLTANAPLRLSRQETFAATVAALTTSDPAFRPNVFELAPAARPGRGTLIVRGDHPGALIAKDASRYTIDLSTGAVTSAIDARRAAWGTYLYNILDPLHFGYLGDKTGAVVSYALKVIWALAGLTPGVLSITGGYMWMLRRRRSRAAAAVRQSLASDHRSARPASPFAVPPTSAKSDVSWWSLRGRPESWASAIGVLVFLLAGYWLQAAVWQRGWLLTEGLWQHWIIKPLCLTLLALPVTLAALWLGRQAMRSAARLRDRGDARATAEAIALGLLGTIPIGLLYLAGTAVLN